MKRKVIFKPKKKRKREDEFIFSRDPSWVKLVPGSRGGGGGEGAHLSRPSNPDPG